MEATRRRGRGATRAEVRAIGQQCDRRVFRCSPLTSLRKRKFSASMKVGSTGLVCETWKQLGGREEGRKWTAAKTAARHAPGRRLVENRSGGVESWNPSKSQFPPLLLRCSSGRAPAFISTLGMRGQQFDIDYPEE